MAEIPCGKSLALSLSAEGWWRVRWVTAARRLELRVSTPVFQVRYSPLIKVKSALNIMPSKYRWVWRMVESRKRKCPYRRFYRTAEAHGIEVFRCFCTSPTKLVCTFRHFELSLAVCPLFHLFYFFGLSFSKIITWAGTYWSSSSSMLTLLGVSPRREKQVKQGELRSEWGQKGGMSSDTLSSELLICNSQLTAAVWTRGCPCWCSVFALWALRVNEPFYMLRLCKSTKSYFE